MSLTARLPEKVLIVGAGIGGLSLAIALGRRGIRAELIEKNPRWDVYGVGIILQSNAIRALDSLGLAKSCIEAGYPYSVSTHCTADGAVFRDRPKPNVGNPGLPSSCGIMRRDLHRLLSQAALGLGCPVRLGITVEDLRQDDAGVDVRFSDGARNRYDLVVGADGVASSIRAMLFGKTERPTFTGQGCWRFTARRHRDVDRALFYHGKQSLAGLIPMTEDLMYLLLLTAEPGNPYFANANIRDALAQRLSGYGGIVGELAKHLPDAQDIIYRPLEPLLVQGPWSQGRIVLIGDSVHSTSPHLAQGASMAFEDAVVLDELLASAGGMELSHVLLQFRERRFARCKTIIESSVQMGAWQMEKWNGQDVQDADPIGLSAQVLEALRAPI